MPIALTVKEYTVKQFHRMKRAELIHQGDFKAISAVACGDDLVITALVGPGAPTPPPGDRNPGFHAVTSRQVFILTCDEVLPAELGVASFVGTVAWSAGLDTQTKRPSIVLFHIFVR